VLAANEAEKAAHVLPRQRHAIRRVRALVHAGPEAEIDAAAAAATAALNGVTAKSPRSLLIDDLALGESRWLTH